MQSARFVYLTHPSATEPTLNLMVGNEFSRYRVTRNQLLYINAQIADTLLKREIGPQEADQLMLPFGRSDYGTSN